MARSLNYGLSYPHAGFTGVIHLRIATFMALIEDVAVGLATMGFRRIVFLNGHYDNTYAIAYACASAAERLPAGLHANRAETSAVMAIDPDLVDIDRANAEMPPFPAVTSPAAVHTAFFFSTPGSVHRATRTGTWGDARESSAEYGERYLQVVTEATVRMLDDIERTFEAMPAR